MSTATTPTVFYRTLNVEGLTIFYREAGPQDGPTIMLLHGFPSSSHMYRNLIPMLAGRYHVLAPDFPGYGESSSPPVSSFDYSFERFATVIDMFAEKLNLSSYALYLSDIGASVGFHLAVKHPERVTAMIIQNADAYVEAINKEFLKTGLLDYWDNRSENERSSSTRVASDYRRNQVALSAWCQRPSKISPDNWVIDQAYQDRPGNKEIQLAILYNAKRNLDAYADWQEYFREQQPPTLVTWGKHDGIFTVEGAELYKKIFPMRSSIFSTPGHFALEEEVTKLVRWCMSFLTER